MTKPKMFEKPSGVRDYLPDAVTKLKYIERQSLNCMSQWGYEQIVTPSMEFYDTVGMASATLDHKLFKLLNQRGTAMVLRSDMTAPIARVASSLMQEAELPIRLSYHANVFRSMEEDSGREAEFYQTGAELIGDASPEADAEVIALSISCLQAAGVKQFKVAIGHHGFLHGLLEQYLPDQHEVQHQLKQYLVQRDVVGYRELVQELAIDEVKKGQLNQILRLRGGILVIAEARHMAQEESVRASLQHLELLWEVLDAYGVAEMCMLDLSMVGDFSYYTGTIFEGYAADQGSPVMSGGRYDNLLTQFGRPAPATGFALKTTRLMDALRLNEAHQASLPVLIQYDEWRRAEAFQEAARLRAQGERVITRRVNEEEQLGEVERRQDQQLFWRGNRYQEVLTFVRFLKEHV